MQRATVVLALAIAAAVAGCMTKNTTTEGDRQVLHQTKQAVGQARGAVEDLQGAEAEGTERWTMLGFVAVRLLEAERNMDQQLEVHGTPENPQGFSPEASQAAREQSKKEHAGGGWLWTAVGIAGTVVGTLIGAPWIGKLIPPLGRFLGGPIAGSLVKAFALIRQRGEANGGVIGIKDALDIAHRTAETAGVQPAVAKMAAKVEEKLGLDFKIKLAPPPPDPVPAPAPAPSPGG